MYVAKLLTIDLEHLKEQFIKLETKNYKMRLNSPTQSLKNQNSRWMNILEFEFSKQ